MSRTSRVFCAARFSTNLETGLRQDFVRCWNRDECNDAVGVSSLLQCGRCASLGAASANEAREMRTSDTLARAIHASGWCCRGLWVGKGAHAKENGGGELFGAQHGRLCDSGSEQSHVRPGDDKNWTVESSMWARQGWHLVLHGACLSYTHQPRHGRHNNLDDIPLKRFIFGVLHFGL